MAQKRMFSLQVVDTDSFMDMPTSAQALYFHLGMHGDDDGFVASPRKIARAAGCNNDDMRLLIAKGYVVQFESGVIVITDWNINNTLKNDRYRETIYRAEKAMLHVGKNGKYCLDSNMVPECIQDGSNMEPQHNITEQNQTEPRITENIEADKPPKRTCFIPPTVDEVREYCQENGYNVNPEYFVDYYTANNWMAGRNKMKDWKATVRNWHRRENEKQAPLSPKQRPKIPGIPTL